MTATEIEGLLSDNIEDWLVTLRPYQARLIRELLITGKTPDEAGNAWVSAFGAPNTALFGTIPPERTLYERIREEVAKFLCGDPSYAIERGELVEIGRVARDGLVAAISTAVASHLGFSTTYIVPMVVLVFCSMGKITLRAFCNEHGNPPTSGRAPVASG